MIASSGLKCPSCRLMFGFEKTPKVLKNCQHTICITCLKTQTCCPIDSVEINLNKWGLKSFLTNVSILEELQNEGKPISDNSSGLRFSFAQKHPKNEGSKLFGSKQNARNNWQLCRIHSRKADFISKSDFSLKCSTCVKQCTIQSSNFISYQELLKVLTQLTDSTYKIYQQLNTNSQQICKRNINRYIETELLKKKEKQAHQIRRYFQSIIGKIRIQQRQVLDRLDAIVIESAKQLKQSIDVESYQNKKQLWTGQVHRLTEVMESIYEWDKFNEACQYLQKNSKMSFIVDQGQVLTKQCNQIKQSVCHKVQQQFQKLQCVFDPNFCKSLERICCFKFQGKIPQQKTTNLFTQSQKKTNLSINKTNQLSYCFKIQRPQLSGQNCCQSQEKQQKSQSQEEDFLLDTQKSQNQKQNHTKNQITFEENYSLVQDINAKNQQFTPILRKQQDSISALEQDSTIINLRNVKKQIKQNTIEELKSQEMTLDFKHIRKNISSSCQKISNNKNELSKTLPFHTPRSPLRSVSNNSQSKPRNVYIPQKYIQMWENAKQDKSQSIDLTGAQLGDTIILHLCSYLSESQNIKSLKLIRNKLTDEIVFQLIQSIRETNIYSLNLSQNSLTQKCLDILQKINLGSIKSITLSLNKIVLRKVKDRIQTFKQKGVTISV